MSSADRASGSWRPQSDSERQQVRDQLERLLSSPGFVNSQRYPNLLRFVVEQTLMGQEDTLKERLLGIDVFRRSPDYDTNQDPVVRLSAAEVRKRIAVYYQQPEHQHELVIGLNPGSYIPYFRPASHLTDPLPPVVQQAEPSVKQASPLLGRLWRPWAAALLLALFLAGGLAWYISARPSVTEQFWSPVLESPYRVTLCVGTPDTFNASIASDQNLAPSPTLEQKIFHSARLGPANVATLIRLGGILEGRHRSFRLLLASQASFPMLREGPVVLVGALDNPWTMRLTQNLRYGFADDGQSMYVVDRKNPSSRQWSVNLKQAPSSQSGDFAVIARYNDTTLGQPVVLAAGLSSQGTEAAGEILSDPDVLKELFKHAPGNWKKVNLEAVVQTQVIDGNPGPSRILAVEYW